jgi:hypothetical protein
VVPVLADLRTRRGGLERGWAARQVAAHTAQQNGRSAASLHRTTGTCVIFTVMNGTTSFALVFIAQLLYGNMYDTYVHVDYMWTDNFRSFYSIET